MPKIAKCHTFHPVGFFARARLGFTLIEALLASTMAVLVLGIAAAVFATVYSTLERQADWRARIVPAIDAMDLIARDLNCAVAPFSVESNLFVLDQARLPGRVESDSSIRFHTALPPAAPLPLERARLVEVRYFLDNQTPDGMPALMREVSPLRLDRNVPELTDRQCLARGLEAFRVRVYKGDGWSNEWNALSFNELPMSARVFIRMSGRGGGTAREFETEVAIPVGIEIKPAADSLKTKPGLDSQASPPAERSAQ